MGHLAHFSRQWDNVGSFNDVLYVATEDGKISRAPTEYMWLQEKQRDSQEKNTKAKKRELNQKKTESTPCLYCSGVYSKSKVGEGWMKGGEFDSWAHKSVQGMNARRSFVTFVTKTGVAHFALQFWQLKKTDHFFNVCFAIFLVKLHRN